MLHHVSVALVMKFVDCIYSSCITDIEFVHCTACYVSVICIILSLMSCLFVSYFCVAVFVCSHDALFTPRCVVFRYENIFIRAVVLTR